MTDTIKIFAKWSLIAAGILLLLESLLGIIYVLGIDLYTISGIITGLCLTMAFPIYLVGIISLRRAAVGLWVFFAAQWIDVCFNRSPPGFVNPLAWVHGGFLFAAAILVSFSAWALPSKQTGEKSTGLLDAIALGKRAW